MTVTKRYAAPSPQSPIIAANGKARCPLRFWNIIARGAFLLVTLFHFMEGHSMRNIAIGMAAVMAVAFAQPVISANAQDASVVIKTDRDRDHDRDWRRAHAEKIVVIKHRHYHHWDRDRDHDHD
jgi:hypothetical protein